MKILAVFGRNAYGDATRGEGYEHANMLPDLELIAGGGNVRLFDSWDRSAYADFAALNVALVREVAAFQPDVIFFVLMTHEIWLESLEAIAANSPAALINWGTDDSWKYAEMTQFIAPLVDLHITTDLATARRAAERGDAHIALSQWAASSGRLCLPCASADCDYDVSFVGACYGNRAAWVGALAERGIKVDCFGKGWGGGVVSSADIARIVRRSRISLNFSDSGLQIVGGRIQRSRQIKARTFEVPGAGGFLLTEPAEGLERYFNLSTEMATYENADDLAAKIGFYLSHPVERDAMAQQAHARVAREHTYRARLPALFELALRNAAARRTGKTWQLDPSLLDAAAKSHEVGPIVKAAGAGLMGLCRFALGNVKGSKAARRFVHEVSWRLAGACTYRAAGLPGRMFYRDR
jgi:spore maturation protein CgeB